MTTNSLARKAVMWLLLATFGVSFTLACDQCFFTSEDAEDCRVYGNIDGVLVAWTRASKQCLDSYNLKVTGVDPFSAGCDPESVNTFVNAVRLGTIPNSVLAGLGVANGGFFEPGAGGSYVLKSTITVDRQTISCEGSSSDCYTAMRSYFADGAPGQQERNDVCSTILTRVANDREVEQATSRIRICQDIMDGLVPSVSCGNLVDEVQTAMDQAPDKLCSGFGFGSGTSVAPGCELQAGSPNEPSSDSNRYTPQASWIISSVAVVLVNVI